MVTCPFCDSSNTVKAGIRYNNRTVKQRFKCNKCKRRFVIDDGFLSMHYPPEIIAEVISSKKRGMTME